MAKLLTDAIIRDLPKTGIVIVRDSKVRGLRVYFADPYAAWQRGANENANGLLRQYFPKGSDLSALAPSALASAVKRLNHRPRKCLGYQSPHEVLSNASRGALQN